MSTLYALIREGGVFFCEVALNDFSQASIRDVPIIQDIEIITAEGRHIAHDGKWILIHTVESLTAGHKLRAAIGSVEKAAVITRIQDHLRQQSDDVSEVTLSRTSSHCDVIGGRIAKQVTSTIEAGKYLNEYIDKVGWEVNKAGKDFITLKRKFTIEEATKEEVEAAVGQGPDTNHEETVAEVTDGGNKRSLFGKLLS